MADIILAIDHGTTGTTCLVVAMHPTQTQILGRGYAEFPQHFPEPGWVEHDLLEIWHSAQAAIRAALTNSAIDPKQLRAIGITNQRETTGVWDRQGRPLHHAIVWQDRRTAPTCQRLRDQGHSEMIRSRTGLVIDPYFSGTKLGWLLEHVPGLRARAERGDVHFGTMDTWLAYQLSGRSIHVTDATNASRTMLYDIRKQQWDAELCALLGDIPTRMLPSVAASNQVVGRTQGLDILPDGIPIAGIAGDQQAALFGQACFKTGMAKCTYGTGAFALVNTGNQCVPSARGMLSTIAWRLGNETTYALEGSTFVAGAIVQWLRDGLQMIKSSAEIEALAATVPDTGGVTLVPALTGLGAPHWRPEARGLIMGLTRGTQRGHIARAALEGIALQVADLLDAMRADSGQNLLVMRADGGAAANNILMQFQADILDIEIHRPTVVETTALGAAYLAALGIGIFASVSDIEKSWQAERVFKGSMKKAERDERIKVWQRAVAMA